MSASTPEDRIAALEAAVRVKTAPAPKLSPLGERVAKALEAAEPSPGVTLIVGLGAIWIAWGWRAADIYRKIAVRP